MELKKNVKFERKSVLIFISIIFILIYNCLGSNFGVNISHAAEDITLTFSDDSITETVSGSGYTIDGTTLTISSAGTYIVTGSCSEGSIQVAKGTTGVTLILNNLTLTSSSTAPIILKKTSSVTIKTEGESTITNTEDPDNETSTDTDVADAFEGACIKVKSGASLTLSGDGILNCVGTTKNGIKGAATSSVTVNSGTINVTATNNGIAADGSVIINGGTITINSDNDGIKAVPDDDDTESLGTIVINGGNITINSNGDGIQAANSLTITDGTFNIKTLDGYNSSNFDSSTMSCKGLKASGSETTTTEESTSIISITGGTFSLNTADDAIHSDGYVVITGGTFDIYAGDDGVHADTSLTLGSDGGLERDPEITINSCYEGLESGNVYIYSGKYYIIGKDDGINAAGGSSDGTDGNSPGGNDHFNSGGGPGMSGSSNSSSSSSSTTSDYSIYIYGGNIYINVEGDGIDSNGNIYIYGGNTEVWGMKSGGDNEPIDHDGTLEIKEATVFAGGTKGMTYVHADVETEQEYVYSTTSYSNGQSIYVKNGNSTEYSTTVPKSINYIFFTSPDTTSSYSLSTTGTATCKEENSWSHTWDSGTVTTAATATSTGVMTYTCTVCETTERKTINAISTVDDGSASEETTTYYTATFEGDTGVEGINVYYTHDYTTTNEENVTSTYARSDETGEPLSDGNGQVNFLVLLKDGYEIESVTASGNYKNIKDSSTTGVENLYRVTKITGDLTITITTVAHTHSIETIAEKAATCTEKGNIAYYYCSGCGKYFEDATGNVEITDLTSVETSATGHKLTKVDAVKATCVAKGNIEYYECSVCGKKFSDSTGTTEVTDVETAIDSSNHTWGDWEVITEATETTTGTKRRTCQNNSSHYQETEIPVTTHTHKLTKTAAKAATCTEDGNIEYYMCSGCNLIFSDADGTNEITLSDTVISKTGHLLELISAKSETCTEDGNIAYYVCTNCNKYYGDKTGTTEIDEEDTVISATGHSMESVSAKSATCTETGNTAYYYCTSCKKYFSDANGTKEITQASTVISATGHKLTKVDAVVATCSSKGNIEYYECSVCGKKFSNSTGTTEITDVEIDIDSDNHAWGDWVITKAATTTEEGSKTRTCNNNSEHTDTLAIAKISAKPQGSTDDDDSTEQDDSKTNDDDSTEQDDSKTNDDDSTEQDDSKTNDDDSTEQDDSKIDDDNSKQDNSKTNDDDSGKKDNDKTEDDDSTKQDNSKTNDGTTQKSNKTSSITQDETDDEYSTLQQGSDETTSQTTLPQTGNNCIAIAFIGILVIGIFVFFTKCKKLKDIK